MTQPISWQRDSDARKAFSGAPTIRSQGSQVAVLGGPLSDRIPSANRFLHEVAGIACDREIMILRLSAPHIRRAVTISDLMDLKTLETDAMAAALNQFALGVVIVADDSRILHANEAARNMFAAGAPVRSVRGRLTVGDPRAGRELAQAIALAWDDEPAIGAAGIGVALNKPTGEPAVAHVLPLAPGDIRTRLMPQATAVVFVTQAADRPAINVSAIAESFKLTPREARLLQELIAGTSLAAAAIALDIAETTAKTHLGNIFSKAGVARQADLDRAHPPLGAAAPKSPRQTCMTPAMRYYAGNEVTNCFVLAPANARKP